MSKPQNSNNNNNAIINELITLIEVAANGKKKLFNCGNGIMLYRGEIHLLKKISDYPGIYISETARNFNITRAVVSKTAIKLEKEGLLRKVAASDDKKRIRLYLTPRGEEVCAVHDALHRESDSSIFDFLETLQSDELDVIEAFMKEANIMIKHHF